MIKRYMRWLIVTGLLPLAGGIALLVWLWGRRRGMLSGLRPAQSERIVLPEPAEPFEPVGPSTGVAEEPAQVQPDDLTVIEGIGPKIAGVLRAAGIVAFAQLAALDVAQLKTVLKEGGIRIANPETWPEQAALAAREDWEGLAALQSALKAGRTRGT